MTEASVPVGASARADATGVDDDPATIARLRRGLLLIALATIVGTVVELAMQKHWTQPVQLVAWAALVALLVAVVLLLRPPSGASVRAARALAGLVCVTALFGVLEHIDGNYEAGPLDARYADTWDAMSEVSRWWAATIQAVGPSPALAPGVLVLAALCVLVASIGLPGRHA
jgi:hypothetical protein